MSVVLNRPWSAASEARRAGHPWCIGCHVMQFTAVSEEPAAFFCGIEKNTLSVYEIN